METEDGILFSSFKLLNQNTLKCCGVNGFYSKKKCQITRLGMVLTFKANINQYKEINWKEQQISNRTVWNYI